MEPILGDKWFAKWVKLKAKSVKPPITEEQAYLSAALSAPGKFTSHKVDGTLTN